MSEQPKKVLNERNTLMIAENEKSSKENDENILKTVCDLNLRKF